MYVAQHILNVQISTDFLPYQGRQMVLDHAPRNLSSILDAVEPNHAPETTE